jgi:ABC-type dipeptide/oligopeptide/nickel transport system permease component
MTLTSRLARNLVRAVVVLFGISLITFMLSHVIGDPVSVLLPLDAPASTRATYRHEMGLDRPIAAQYLAFAGDIVRGRFGDSFLVKKPAIALIAERIPRTLLLAASGMVIAITIAFPLGILAAYRRRSFADSASLATAVAGAAIPIYWLGLMLQIVLGVHLHWLPPSGYGSWRHLILPAFTLGVFLAPVTMRLVRSGMIDVLNQEYVRTARAKGLPEARVLLRHAFRNMLIPVLTVLGLQFGQLMGGAVITETVFAWPGVASLVVQAIQSSDFPVTQAAVMILAMIILVVNLSVDTVAGTLDPRLRV